MTNTMKVITAATTVSVASLAIGVYTHIDGADAFRWDKEKQSSQEVTQEYKQSKEQKGKQGQQGSLSSFEANQLEAEHILFSYAEEMLARDVYNYLDELYPETDVFGHIAQSEQKHMDAVSKLIDKANLEAPTGYGELTDTYNALISQGSESLQQALEVGVQIEILDIDDLKHMMSEIDNETINSTFTRIGDASYTHLAAFMSELQKNGFDSQHDWDNYISQEDIDNMKDHSSQNRGHGKDRDKDCDRMNTGQEGSENGHGKQMQR